MIRRPPRSTLFPLHDALPISFSLLELQLQTTEALLNDILESKIFRAKLRLESDSVGLTTSKNALGGIFPRHLDRNSTRLNSSHQIISHAVFCLKKKYT